MQCVLRVHWRYSGHLRCSIDSLYFLLSRVSQWASISLVYSRERHLHCLYSHRRPAAASRKWKASWTASSFTDCSASARSSAKCSASFSPSAAVSPSERCARERSIWFENESSQTVCWALSLAVDSLSLSGGPDDPFGRGDRRGHLAGPRAVPVQTVRALPQRRRQARLRERRRRGRHIGGVRRARRRRALLARGGRELLEPGPHLALGSSPPTHSLTSSSHLISSHPIRVFCLEILLIWLWWKRETSFPVASRDLHTGLYSYSYSYSTIIVSALYIYCTLHSTWRERMASVVCTSVAILWPAAIHK